MAQRSPRQSIFSFFNRSRSSAQSSQLPLNHSDGVDPNLTSSNSAGSNLVGSNSTYLNSQIPSARRRYSRDDHPVGASPAFDFRQHLNSWEEPDPNTFSSASEKLDTLLSKLQQQRQSRQQSIPQTPYRDQSPRPEEIPDHRPRFPRQPVELPSTAIKNVVSIGHSSVGNPSIGNPSNPRVVPLNPRKRKAETKRVPPDKAQVRQVQSKPLQTQQVQAKPSANLRPRKRPTSPVVYGIRLLILGIGIGVISGTVLSVLNSMSQLPSAEANSNPALKVEAQSESSSQQMRIEALPLALQLNQELKPLKQEIQDLVSAEPNLKPGILMVDLDTGSYIDLNSKSAMAAASTIKVPILIAFFQAVDQGQIQLDEKLTLEDKHIATGSGDLQHRPPGTQYTALNIATKMITISDNTATNILLERLGGTEALNQKFADWGLSDTALRNPLPDLKGTNKTSSRDLVNLLTQLNQGGLVSMKSRDRALHILQQTENDALIPSGLGEGAIAAHKTGNLKSVAADVGLIDMPSGKRYLLAVLVERSDGDTAAESLIRDISRTVYKHFAQSAKPISPEPLADPEKAPKPNRDGRRN
ncbi:MAG: serine hydrolase [Microcoleaceae cyanobacterium]